MSLFNKVLASVGIGSASVNTMLENEILKPGEKINGIVEVHGGNISQNIDNIYLTINTQYTQESDDQKYNVTTSIENIHIASAFTIGKNEVKSITFSFPLPLDTPITVGKTKVWVSTGLDIKNGVDPTDTDYVRVEPHLLLQGILDSISSLGFRLREVECEKASYHNFGRLPFVQEFEFVAVSGDFFGRLDELEFVFIPTSLTSADLYFQIDRKRRGLSGFLSEALNMDESNIRISVSTNELGNFTQKLYYILKEYC